MPVLILCDSQIQARTHGGSSSLTTDNVGTDARKQSPAGGTTCSVEVIHEVCARRTLLSSRDSNTMLSTVSGSTLKPGTEVAPNPGSATTRCVIRRK